MIDTPRITVIGESLVDVVVTPYSRREFPGGSPMNVAVGLGRLGSSVAIATSIGTDERGVRLRDHLLGSGVELVPGSVVDGSTSTSTAHIDSSGAARYEFDIEWSLAAVHQMPSSPIVHTGSIASFLSPGADDVEGYMVDARSRAVTTFDPNIRASLIDSRQRTIDRVEAVAAASCVVKMSDEDSDWLYPGRPFDWVLSHLLELGSTLVILTKGESGSELGTASTRVRLPSKRVIVADTIGAGDSYMSGVIHSLDQLLLSPADRDSIIGGTTFTETVLTDFGTFAASCAGLTVSRFGADPPTLAEVGRD